MKLKINTSNESASPLKFLNKLWEIALTAKKYHLEQPVPKLAPHLVMGELYDAFDSKLDGFTEKVFGVYGTMNLDMKACSFSMYENQLDFVTSSYNYIKSNKSVFPESFIQNLIDGFSEDLAQALYKLKYLPS